MYRNIESIFLFVEKRLDSQRVFSYIGNGPGDFDMTEDTRIRLGSQLEVARRGRHWTLNDVAQRIGRQPGRISEIEGGKANSTIQSLSEAGDAVGLSLVFVPNDRLAEVLTMIGTAEPKTRPPLEVTSVYDDVFIPDETNVTDGEEQHERP
jgi:transcriptional regulator with XRE-family HTH domain